MSSIGDGRAGVKPGHFDKYEQGFADLAESSSVSDDRQLIAAVLLSAVEQSFVPHDHKARRWLCGIYAQSLFILIDISPSTALEHLEKKWHRIDADALTPPPGYTPH
ncbi:hypothetical protein [Acidithiobacillus ferriphilus]|uniref:hypothetical protein n=1 Tax=Acidithiobacillus ferriphilus TaxID=1689834 RepID=UPI001D020399|nr:hypothetical protein [Acidithiobacillus ferriphilus]